MHSLGRSDAPIGLRPWVMYSDDWLICLQCPMDKTNRKGQVYYRGINTAKRTRNQVRRWIHTHRRCGFQGMML